jgi:hypothetical protein
MTQICGTNLALNRGAEAGMDPLLLPAPQEPEDDGDAKTSHAGGARSPGDEPSRRRRAKRTLSPEDCLEALSTLPGLLVTRFLNTSQVNALTKIYNAILQQHRGGPAGKEQRLPDGDVLEVLRRDPRLCSMLEPLLTDDQIDLIFKQAGNHGTEQP